MLSVLNLKIHVLFFLFYVSYSEFAREQCSSDSVGGCTNENFENKYAKDINTKYSKYLHKIQAAKASYIPCNETNCNCHSSVISNDLKPFETGITKQLFENVRSKGTKYQIINHKLYRDKDCMFPARCSGIEHFLLKLTDKLADTELIINTRDWPQVHSKYGLPGPVLSFSKTDDYLDIMYPAWSFWEGGPAIGLYPTGIGRWDRHRLELGRIGNETDWNDKIGKGFFRGSRTSSERDPLVLLSREFPDLVDAKFTKNQAWKSDADTLHSPPASEVSFRDHCEYKYLFNFRGVAASFRFKHILLCKSLVFHVGDEWLEFFYPALKPWIHYVPIEADATKESIREVLEFMMEHDDAAKEIAENGYNMIWFNLKMKDVVCYWKKLLKKYTALLKYKPVLDRDLVEIRPK